MSSVSSHEGPRSALPSPTDSMEARNGLEATARNPSFSNNGEGPGWSSGSLGNGRGPLMGSSLGHRRKMDFSNMLGVSPPLMGASVETALPDHMGRSAPNYGGSHPDPLLGESSSTRLEDDANATGSPIEMPSDDDDFADNQPHAAPSYFAATPPATWTGAQSRAVVDSTASPTTAQSLSLSSATALPPAGFDSRNPSSAMQQTMRPSQHPAPLGPPASNHSSPSLPSVTRHDAPNERGVNEWSAGNSTLSSLTSTPVHMNSMQHQHHRHHQQYGPPIQQQTQQFGFPAPTSTPPLAQSGKLMRRAVSLGDISSLPYQQHHPQTVMPQLMTSATPNKPATSAHWTSTRAPGLVGTRLERPYRQAARW